MSVAARPLLPREVLALSRVASPRDRALLWCCLGGGLRAAEAADLRCGDLGADGSLLVRDGKGGIPREVYLTGQALEAVSQWRVTLEHQGPDDPLFPSRKTREGKPSPMRPTTVVARVQQLMREAGIANASSHSLRRTHAQGLEALGVGVRTIQRQLGHRHIHTTEIYLAKNPIGHRDAVRKLEFRDV